MSKLRWKIKKIKIEESEFVTRTAQSLVAGKDEWREYKNKSVFA